MDPQIELLKTCVAVENLVADIYSHFAVRFPEESGLWKGIAAEEKGHARLFLMLNCFKHGARIPAILPESLALAKKALEEVNEARKKALAPALTYEEALDIAVSLELSTIETFLNSLIAKQTEGELKQLLTMLINEGRNHGSVLKKALSDIKSA